MEQPALFSRLGSLREYLELLKEDLRKEVERFERNYILNASEEDLCTALASKYQLEPPVIRLENQYVVSHGDSRQDPVSGTSITIAIPFEGNERLLERTPSTFTSAFPRGEIIRQEIRFTLDVKGHDREYLRRQRTEEVDLITKYVGWSKDEVDSYNKSLPAIVRQYVLSRKKKLLDDLGLVRSLEIPVKREDGVSQNYPIPIVRKKARVELPQVKDSDFSPEPALADEVYEDILGDISSMSLVMERNPRTFRKLEEEIRDHFLMYLNVHYEGKATGETFNFNGKTDILIRHDNKNAFIAECKIWQGEKKLIDTIDQLLSYTCWRDTKTAILVFNKNLDFTSVLAKIDPVMKSHQCFKRVHNLRNSRLKNETTFGYVFHQPDDINRELILTVMAFTISTPTS